MLILSEPITPVVVAKGRLVQQAITSCTASAIYRRWFLSVNLFERIVAIA